MAAAVPRETGVAAFARNAPSAMTGQYCGPIIVSAAMAIPVGGQTSEMLCPMEAYCSPSNAAP
jgi:hypothetical protein